MCDVYLVVYAKSNTEIIYRLVKSGILYKNNTSNGMGWYIVDIQKYHNGCFLPIEDVKKIVNKNIEKRKKKDKRIVNRNKFKSNLKVKLKRIINKI